MQTFKNSKERREGFFALDLLSHRAINSIFCMLKENIQHVYRVFCQTK